MTIATGTVWLIVLTAVVQATILTMNATDAGEADGMHQERNAMPVTGQDAMWSNAVVAKVPVKSCVPIVTGTAGGHAIHAAATEYAPIAMAKAISHARHAAVQVPAGNAEVKEK